MLLSLFIPFLVLSTFVDKCVAVDSPNSVEQLMLHICKDLFGVKENGNNNLWSKTIAVKNVATSLLKNNKDLIEEGLKMHVLLKVNKLIFEILLMYFVLKLVAGTTEIHKLTTLNTYFDVCYKLVENESKRKAEAKKEKSTSGKGKKEEQGSSHVNEKTAKHEGKQGLLK